MIIVKYIQEFLWNCCGQCGVSSVSDSSSLYLRSIGPFQCSRYYLHGFNLLHLSLPKRFPLLCLFWLPLQVYSVSNFHPDTRGRRWSFIQANLFSCATGREEHCKQISLVCVGSACSVWATLGLPPLTACVLSPSTLLRLLVALQGSCLRRALGCMNFPGLSHSGSGSRVFHKGTNLAGPAFCALPKSQQLRQPDACLEYTPQVGGVS